MGPNPLVELTRYGMAPCLPRACASRIGRGIAGAMILAGCLAACGGGEPPQHNLPLTSVGHVRHLSRRLQQNGESARFGQVN